jgi:hypothetical protein
MPYDGYLELGGRELANAARTFQYVTDLSAFGLHDCQGCEDLAEALDETYTTPAADPAPWFDPSDPDTGQFFGFYPTQIEGLSTSTRESVNVELVGDGSVQTSQRRAGRDIMVRGAMFAETREALDKGFSWLDNTLNSEACQGERARLFSACPEVIEYPPIAFEPVNLGETGQILRTNLAENPDLDSISETGLATPIARTNLLSNPSMQGGSFIGQDGTFTLSNGTGASGDMDGVDFRAAEIDVPNTISGVSITSGDTAPEMATVTAGQTYTLSAYAFQTAVMYSARVTVQWFDVGGGFISQMDGATTALAANVWERRSTTAVAPVGATGAHIRIVFTDTGGIVGESIFAGGGMVEETGTLKPLIVGDISLDPNLDSDWSGAAYASTTEAFPHGVSYPTSDLPTRMDSAQGIGTGGSSNARAASGVAGTFGQSLAISPITGNASYAYLDVQFGSQTSAILQPGRTYRVSADVTLLRPMSVGGPSILVDTGLNTLTSSGTNTTGTQTLSITFTADGTGSDSRLIRLTGNGSGFALPEDVSYWDHILIEDVTDGVPVDTAYFDGDTPDTATFTYSWTGAPNASPSTQSEAFDFPTEAAMWQSTSGTITATPTSVRFDWDTGDAEKAAWRTVTGLIPGEQYQLRLKMDGTPTKVSIGSQNVAPDSNRSENPRWLDSQFDGLIIAPAPQENQFNVPGDGPLGLGWRKYVYPSDTAADTIFVTDTMDLAQMVDVLDLWDLTISAYAFSSAESTVELVARYLDALGGQVGTDVIVDTDTSIDEWVQLSGPITVPNGIGATYMQLEVRYTTAGPITAGTEFGVWGAMVSPSGSTTYFDGHTPGYVWSGAPDASTSEIDAGVEWVTYWNFSGTTWEPPFEPTVLDFVPRSEEVTIYLRSGGGALLDVELMRVWRVPNPGVVAFSTNELDMVPPSDGWQHDPITDAIITSQIIDVQNVFYSGELWITVTAAFGETATVGATDGPYRASFGLIPGVTYRLAVDYAIMYDGAATPGEPVIDGAIAQSVVYAADNDLGDTIQSYRVIEFTPGSSSVTVRFEVGAVVMLASQESLQWQFGEILVEEVFEEADTEQPDPLRDVTRTLYNVAAITGPQMTNLRHASCGWMAQVTFGLRSGNPGIFRNPVLAGGLPTSVSTLQEAIPCIDGVQARVNFMYNPSVEVALNPVGGRTDYAQSGGVITREQAGGPGPLVGSWFVQGDGVTQIVGYYGPFTVTDGLVPIGGNTYVHSVYVSADVSGSYDWTLGLNYPGPISDVVNGSVLITANEWTRVVNVFTVPLGNELDLLEFHLQDNGAISGFLYMDGYMVEPGDTAGTVWDDTFTGVEWSGTELESALLFPEGEADITVDPDCPVIPLPPAPPSVDVACVDEPAAYQRSVITILENVVPRNLTAFPVLTLQAGAQDVRQARIRFWENPDHLTIDELDPCSFDGDIIVSFIPAGATLVIDGVQRTATMTLNGVTQDASHLLYGGDGGPVDWPELTGGIEYLVTLDLDSAGTFSDTQMDVELVVRD